MDAAEEAFIEPSIRGALETIFAELGLGEGHVRVVFDVQGGRIHWYEPTRIRVPASELEGL